MPLFLVLLIIVNSSLATKALPFIKKKAVKELPLNQNIIVGGKFQAKDHKNNEIYELRLAIQDHPEYNVFTIVSLYDESTLNPIEDIVWINQEDSKKPEHRIKAIKVESKINQDLEATAVETNPTLAYDRVHANQHVVSKIFFYNRDEILPVKNKAFLHKLELYMPHASGNPYKNIPIDKFFYKTEDQETKLEVVNPYKKPFWWQRDKKEEKKEPRQIEQTSVQSNIVSPPPQTMPMQSMPSEEEQNLMEMQEAVNQIRNPELDPRQLMMQQQMMQMNALYGSEDSEGSEADELF